MKMKRWPLVIGASLALIGLPVLTGTPVLANLQKVGSSVIAALQGADVQLKMVAEKKIVSLDAEGKEVINWDKLENGSTVLPGDTLRYVISSKNNGDTAAKQLVINQAVPEGMTYLLGSATSENKVNITYQLKEGYKRPEGSQEFEAEPKILVEVPQADGSVIEEVQAAPAEAYAQVRWQFSADLSPKQDINVSYKMQVK